MTLIDVALNEALETIAYLQRRLSSAALLLVEKNAEIETMKSQLDRPKEE